jgi:hypothetical protein
MPRTIVYDDSIVQAHYAAKMADASRRVAPTSRRDALREAITDAADPGKPPPTEPSPAALPTKDELLTKIAKYVPAEVVTLTTLCFTVIEPKGTTVWWLLGGFAILNVLYLFSTTLGTPPPTPPRWFFYALSVVALGLWSAALLTPVQVELGIPQDDTTKQEGYQTLLLLGASLVVPMLDTILSHLKISTT